MQVASWLVLFNALISTDHAQHLAKASQPQARLCSLYCRKLHWMVLLLSRNTERIGMVWGLVTSFLERVRSTALEMVRQRGAADRRTSSTSSSGSSSR